MEKYWFSMGIVFLFCIGILLEKYWFTMVLYFFLYWKSIGLALFYVDFCLGKDGFLYWNSVGKYWIIFLLWNSVGKELD